MRGDASDMANSTTISPERAAEYWSRTRGLMWTTLAVWFVFSFAIHLFVDTLNTIVILGFPLGFYMAAQGSLIIFVALIFWFAGRQNRIAEEFSVAEDERSEEHTSEL